MTPGTFSGRVMCSVSDSPSAWVAFTGGEVIGSVAIGADDSIPNGLASCRLYVGPDWWHQAIGTTLHDVALNHARAGSDGRISL